MAWILLMLYSLLGLWSFVILVVLCSHACTYYRPMPPEVVYATPAVPELAAGEPRKGWYTYHHVERVRPQRSWDLPWHESTGVEELDRALKMDFVRRVYTILSTQLLLTVGIIVLFVGLSFSDFDATAATDFGRTLLGSSWVLLVALLPVLLLLCFLFSVKNIYPINFVALFLFTAAEGALLGVLVVYYYAAGYGQQILIAGGITIGIFAVLTLFTMQTTVDFNYLGPGLVTFAFVLVFWSIFCLWLPGVGAFAAIQLISLFGALIFCGFIIYDTNMIMKYMGVDDAIIAAIELYLDIVNLFVFLLAILSCASGGA